MSKRELQRGGVLARVKAGELRLKDGAELIRVSYRQAKRLWKRYQAAGPASLQHGGAGRVSNRARPAKERQKILRKVQEKYVGFGPALASEHLASEDGLKVHPETLRRWTREEGLWKKARKRKQQPHYLAHHNARFAREPAEPQDLSPPGSGRAGTGAGVLPGDRAQHFQ